MRLVRLVVSHTFY